MSFYIDDNVYLEIQVLSLPSLLGPGVSTELKQRGEDWHFLDNTYILGVILWERSWDVEWLMEVIFNLWVTFKSEWVINKLSWDLRSFNNWIEEHINFTNK